MACGDVSDLLNYKLEGICEYKCECVTEVNREPMNNILGVLFVSNSNFFKITKTYKLKIFNQNTKNEENLFQF